MRPVVRLALALVLGGGALTASTAGAEAVIHYASPPRPRPAPKPHAVTPKIVHAPGLAPQEAAAHPLAHETAPPQAAAVQRLAPGQAIPPAQLETFVDGAVGQAMAHDHIAGATVAVVQNGQVLLKKGYGFAGANRPVDADQTLFRLGSVSKTFTWIAVMKDVEAGRIRLNAPVNLFLPEKLKVKDQGFKRDVMVRDLMTHSAGFEDRALGQLVEDDPRQVRPLFEYLRQERPRRVREAGELPVYSNYGAALAGEAVSYVENRPFPDVIEAEIIRPLGLAHTSFREPYPARPDLAAPMDPSLAANLSRGYRWSDGDFEPQDLEYLSQAAPAAAASSTAGDMARYMLMILNGGQLDGVAIYNADTARGFRTTLQASAPGVDGWDDGFKEFALPGGYRGQGHDGDTFWFHSAMVTVPALGLGVFVAANTDTGGGLTGELPKQIVGRFYAPSAASPPAGSSSLAGDANAYAGTYLNDRRPYGGLGKFALMLTSQMKVDVTPDGRLLTSDSDETQAWVPDGADGRFRAVDGPDVGAFLMQDGRAVRWFDPAGDTAYDRIGPLQQIPTLVVLAFLTFAAAAATLGGQFLRDPREFRQTSGQGRAHLLQATAATLWLTMFVCATAWAFRTRDQASLMLHWPGSFLLIASACALVAALLSLLTLLMFPAVWRGGRRLDSWSPFRKLRYTATTLIFVAFSIVLAVWGALEPWSR